MSSYHCSVFPPHCRFLPVRCVKIRKFCLNSLNDGDRYDVISFADNVTPFKGSLQEYSADKNKADLRKVHEEALAYVEGIRASGGTDINSALLRALAEIKDSKRPAYIVFLTDGLPTVGETNPDKIVANITQANGRKARLFAFGAGYNVNAIMLDRLAEENNGANEYVVEKEDIEVKVSSFYGKVSSPVLSDIAVSAGKGVKLHDMYPEHLPDVFRGSQLILLGRYEGSGTVKVTLTGNAGEEKQTYEYKTEFAKAETAHDFLPRLWAMRKISYLVMKLRANPKGKNSEALQKEITALSQRYGVITEYTSYLIQSRGETIPQNKRLQRVMKNSAVLQQQLLQARRQAEQAGGAGGVKFSRRNLLERSVKNAEDFDREQDKEFRRVQKAFVRNFRDRTFYLNDRDQYVQSDFKEKTETRKVEYLSDEYFALIEKHPDGRVTLRFKPLSAAETPKALDTLCSDLQRLLRDGEVPPLLLLAAFNLDFLCIHPFRDGNGRVSRLLLLLLMYHLGFEAGRYISLERIIEQSKERYYDTLRDSSQGWHEAEHNPWPYINYLLYTIKELYREFEERYENTALPRGEKTAMVERAVQKTISEFSVADIQKFCPGVSIDLIRRSLKAMQGRGEVKCIRKGRGAKWMRMN